MVSRQQKFWNLVGRFVQKPALAAVPSAKLMRVLMDANAVTLYKTPAGLRMRDTTLTHDSVSVKATLCSVGRDPRSGTMLYLHGGGFVIGGLRSYRHLVAALGQAARQDAYFLHYSLAPEHPFPAALDEATAAYLALLARPDAGPVSIVGDSAGGNLAFALLHRICARGLPQPAAVVGLSPAADLRTLGADAMPVDKLLPRNWMAMAQQAYLDGRDPDDPEISPVLGDFAGAAPCLIHADRTEALFASADALVARLQSHDVPVTFTVTQDLTHVWHLNVGRSPEADGSVAQIGGFIRDCVAAQLQAVS